MEYRWFLALGEGAVSVWRARLAGLGVLRGGATVLGAAFVYVNLLAVVSTVDTVVLPRRVGGLDFAERVPAARLRWTAAAVAPLLGLVLAWPLDNWAAVDALVTGRSFGELEPYTGYDLAFFVHWLPLENALYTWALLTLVVTAALVVALYALTPGLRWAAGRPRVSARVRRHLTVFGAGILLLLAWGHRLDAYGLLTSGSGELGAFTAIDDLAAMPARFVLAVGTTLAAIVLLRAGWMNQRRLAFWTVAAVVATSLVTRAVVGPVAARLVDAGVLARAADGAAANRTLYTQRAFAVDRVQGVGGSGARAASAASTVGVSAWDAPALTLAVEAARRTTVEGEVGFQPLRTGDATAFGAVLVEVAPGPPGAPPDPDSRTLLALDAATADPASGRPVPLGAEPLADAGRRLRLRFRPGAGGTLAVLDGPTVVGDPLADWRVRLAHALAGRDLRLAFSGAGRLVARRDVHARVDALAPFFAQGRGAVPVVARDSLWYAVALYGASDAYPLAQRYDINGTGWSAFRHAATALVNAETGAVLLVPAPAVDADTRGWLRRFPGLFTAAAALPDDLARALPPATDGALVQAHAFAQFGARGDRAAAQRRIPLGDGSDTVVAGTGAPMLLVPRPLAGDSSRAEPVPAWTVPLVSAADRADGILLAFGGPHPGARWIAAEGPGTRWQELLDALSDAQARDSTATDARDVVAGRLRAVPAGDGIAYARPEYRVTREGVPAVEWVVALGPAGAAAAATPADALALAAGAAAPASAPNARPAGPGVGDPLEQARRAFRASREALRAGDWAAVGRALDALGAALGAGSGAGTEGTAPRTARP